MNNLKAAEKLGKWAVIDIETTGVDPNYDQIIDVGFLEFEGTKLIRRYESLVQSDLKLSQFIQKLTGITQYQVQRAPFWEDVKNEVQQLYGHTLLAHNADFERSFLDETFRQLDHVDSQNSESYADSLFILGLLAPWFSSLKLENFITEWGVAQSEAHRGLADSEDMLKVLLIGAWHLKDDPIRSSTLDSLLSQYKLDHFWMAHFLSLDKQEIEEVASQLEDWDFHEALEKSREKFFLINGNFETQVGQFESSFDREFSGENIQKIYRDEKAMSERFEGYQYRKSQEELSLRTGQALKNGVHALVQAPTGTGKTLGYLLPSALYSLEENEQVLVATGTKTLQHQAMSKDVPQLYRLLDSDPSELSIVSLVGSQNHLCEMLFRQNNEQEEAGLFDERPGDKSADELLFDERFTNLYFDWVFFHNSHYPDKPILRADLPFVYKKKLEPFKLKQAEVAVDFRSCTGNKCPFKSECSYLQGLRRAKEANIIIGNHSLMFQWPRSFPRPSSIIVDEAHKIESEATKAYSLQVGSEELKVLTRSLGNLQGLGSLFYLLAQSESEKGQSSAEINQLRQKAEQAQQVLRDHIEPLEGLVESFFKKRPRYTDIFWNEAPMVTANREKKNQGDTLSQSIYNHLDSIRFVVLNLLESVVGYLSRWEVKQMENDQMVLAYGRFETFVSNIDDIYRALDLSLESPETHACSMCFHEKYGLTLQCSPIDVGKVLHDQLLENSHSVLFTSATLGNADGDKGVKGIEWASGYTYLDRQRRFENGFFLPAVYDYKNKTKVFLCDDTPSLYSQDFVIEVIEKIAPLIRELGGRSLLLFSAKARFEIAREVLLEKFEGQIPLFIQGMGNNVIDEFKNSSQGILLGMESFGEGIDIPGQTLQFIFIDKIPDLRMDYVIQKRRDFYESHLGNEFVDYYLAHRSRSLHQKLGRLLRTEEDLGGVIIVDSRVKRWKGRTMEKFLHLMRPYDVHKAPLAKACEEVKSFILNNKPLNLEDKEKDPEFTLGH